MVLRLSEGNVCSSTNREAQRSGNVSFDPFILLSVVVTPKVDSEALQAGVFEQQINAFGVERIDAQRMQHRRQRVIVPVRQTVEHTHFGIVGPS